LHNGQKSQLQLQYSLQFYNHSLYLTRIMPPKPQVFKTPDGKEFSTRTEWRDYMMLNFYSFKNKVDEPAPLIKLPGSIDGQMFDIADCSNSTLVVLDHSEQVQMDQVNNCRVFIAACASSIFIRNCENCTFYTSCRQLRLRDVVNCKFYIYSMAEVHIEFSKGLQFAPFNGGYPDHAKHMKAANLDIAHNMWYDIYDHNDPGKTRANWSLLPESEYEEPWFPLGEPCEPAVPRTKPGGVFNPNNAAPDANMQSFSLEQMKADAQKLSGGGGGALPPPAGTPAKAAAAATASPSSSASAVGSEGAAVAPPTPGMVDAPLSSYVATTLEQAALSRNSSPRKPAGPKLPPSTPGAGAVSAAALAATSAASPVAAASPAVVVVQAGTVEESVVQALKLFTEYKVGEDVTVSSLYLLCFVFNLVSLFF
jgi:hypothetical protein